MNNLLMNIQGTVKKFAEVLAKILRVDVEIVDADLNRVAGTGMYKDFVNENIGAEGYVYATVLATGKEKIIMEPGRDEICKYCQKYGNCDETFEVAMPIKIAEDVIGVIGLVCFNMEQRDWLISNMDTYTEFLEQISDLISLKAREEIEKEKTLNILDLLERVVGLVEQGVLLVDPHGRVDSMNKAAQEILGLKEIPKEIDYVKETGNEILDFTEFEISIDGKKTIVLGEHSKLVKSAFSNDDAYLFTSIERLEEISTSISISSENMGLSNIYGNSQEMDSLREKAVRLRTSNSTVLITGESGTGKELFARGIHTESQRNLKPFVAINCAAIPDALLESELFGYVKGAFTGADPKGKIGKIELSSGGTLFLDEIGDMPLYLQSKLLRVLEEKEITRLGSNKVREIDLRVIAATNKDLEKLIEEKMFREDLFYRLNVIPFHIPPLRERKDDIVYLVNHFVEKYSELFNKSNIRVDREVWNLLNNYDWPGNVRELENCIEYSLNMIGSNSIMQVEDLPRFILEDDSPEITRLNLDEMEKIYIKKALALYGNDQEGKQKAADELGIGIATLYRRIKKYEIS